MTLTRVTGKVFGGSAPLEEIGQFGSAKLGTENNTQDVATIQALPAYSNGWGSGVISSQNFPPMEEVTGVLKTISYQGCYTLQEGIPAYDANTTYSNTSIVKDINGGNVVLYASLIANNTNNSLTDTTKWQKTTVADINGVNWGSSVKNIDSGWTSLKQTLSTASSIGYYDIDLSSILPNDTYSYECIFSMYMNRGSGETANNDNAQYYIYNSNRALTWYFNVIDGPRTDADTIGVGGQFSAIVGTERKLVLRIATKNLLSQELLLKAYRRIGTNQ